MKNIKIGNMSVNWFIKKYRLHITLIKLHGSTTDLMVLEA